MATKINAEQLRLDLDLLSAEEFKAKYPGFEAKKLKELTMNELQRRVSKSNGEYNGWTP
jgi:hypothetical protein